MQHDARIPSSRLAFLPSAGSLGEIDRCARDIVPADGVLRAWHDDYLRNHRLRIAHDLDMIRGTTPRAHRILECGSIPLILTAALARAGYEVAGCDLAPERYSGAIRTAGLNVVKCDLESERLPFDDGTFHTVILNEMFEHLRINPIFTLSEVFRVLKPGGTLTLSTPNLKSLRGIRNFLLADRAYSCSAKPYDEYRKLETIGHMGHVREYTPTEVIEFLQAIGFTVAAILYRGESSSALERTLIRLMPRLSPFASYVARRPG